MDLQEIRAVLSGVIDPELGLNIVDLGLVYGVAVTGNAIDVRMTMTTPSCPLGELLVTSVEDALARNFPYSQVKVDLVWEPPWHPALMSEASRRILGVGDRGTPPQADVPGRR